MSGPLRFSLSGFRPVPTGAGGSSASDTSSSAPDGEALAHLSDGEYRTVLAAERTLLAFLRTALAVLVVFRDSALGPILASLVAATGIFQFATATPLFLVGRWREPNPGGAAGGRADGRALFRLTQVHVAAVGVLVVVCVSIAIPWRYGREVDDVATLSAQTALEVFD